MVKSLVVMLGSIEAQVKIGFGRKSLALRPAYSRFPIGAKILLEEIDNLLAILFGPVKLQVSMSGLRDLPQLLGFPGALIQQLDFNGWYAQIALTIHHQHRPR